jgi:hypothetical protein
MRLIRYWLKALFCRHEYKWVWNFYGDAIIAHNWKRSRWDCRKCGWPQFRDELYERPHTFSIQEPTGPF